VSTADGAEHGRLDRSIPALLLSAFCTSAAALAAVTALGKQVYDISGRELDLGLLGLAEFAPAALLVLITGAVADRLDRRRVVGVSALALAGVGIALALYTHSTPTAVAPIFMLVVAFGVFRAFIAPSARSLPADLVPPERLPWLVARYSISFQSALIVGPVIGGTVYAIDPSLPYLVMAGLLVVAATAIQFVRPVPRQPRAPRVAKQRATLHEALEGLRFIRGQPVLLGAISLDLFAVLFGGAIALLPAIAEDRLGVDAVGLGWLRAAAGIGAGAVTLVLARFPIRRRVGRTLLLVVAAFGIGTIVLGITHSFVVAFIAMAALSGADAVSVFIRSTLVPIVTPSDKRGRVLAVENVFIGASNELGAFESGVAGQLLGAPGAVVLGGVATLAIAGGWWTLFPALRNIDEFPSFEPAASDQIDEQVGHGLGT
jgi:MFS family permease